MDEKTNALVPVVVDNSIQKVDNRNRFEPQSLQELVAYSEFMSNSTMVSKDFQGNPANIVIACQMGATVGFNAGQSLQNISVYGGRANIWGDAMLALAIAHPDCIDVVEDDIATIRENECATCIAKRRGREDKIHTYTKADAELAGLLDKKGPWQTNPWRMMQMRARGFALRDQFPDSMRGLGMVEEREPSVKEAPKPLKLATPVPNEAVAVDKGKQDLRDQRTAELISGDIRSAKTIEELEKIAIQAKDLQDPWKSRLRQAYKKRVEELRKEIAASNP